MHYDIEISKDRQTLIIKMPIGEFIQGVISPSVCAQLVRGIRGRIGLTNREMDVFKHVQAGLQNKEIANKLNMSVSAVKYYVGNIFLKLDIRSREEVVARRFRRARRYTESARYRDSRKRA